MPVKARWKKYFNNSSKSALIWKSQNTFVAQKPETMTTPGGNPVADNQNSITAGPRGLLLIQEHQRSRARH